MESKKYANRLDVNIDELGFRKRKQRSHASLRSLLLILSLASLSATLPLVSSYAFTATTTNSITSSSGSARTGEKWSFPRQRRHSSASSSSLQMYVPSNSPTSKTAPMVAQAFYSSQHNQRIQTKSNKSTNVSNHQASASPLSNSVLSSQDTLPSFPTAHGLLSPETVLRMEQMVQSRRHNAPVSSSSSTSSTAEEQAIDYFLDTYRRQGPMACVPFLSDDTILPHLTNAMRDIIA